jgi:hypothetical protein
MAGSCRVTPANAGATDPISSQAEARVLRLPGQLAAAALARAACSFL